MKLLQLMPYRLRAARAGPADHVQAMTALKGKPCVHRSPLPSEASSGASTNSPRRCVVPGLPQRPLAGLIQWYETLTPERLDDGADW